MNARRCAIVALGANLGDARGTMQKALRRLRELSSRAIKVSSLHETVPVDCPPGSPNFLNAVALMVPGECETPRSLLAKLQSIERQLGRTPKKILNEPRAIDLDLIAFGGAVIQSPALALPHPRAHLRSFVLGPLAEIAPDLVLPGQSRTVAQLLAGLPLVSRARRSYRARPMKQKAYAAAGVDIDLGNKVKATLPRLLASTHRREVLGKVGGFGGLFALDTRKYRQPILVSSADGVGTKLKIAFALGKHDTVGQDLVNHCVNDIAVLGAEPLFFLDYIGTGKLEPQVFTELISGFARACEANHCALIGGETAQMPGFYQTGEYDVCGTIVGVVEKSKMLDGKGIKPGDAVIGLASSGLHTNGYSLARKIFFTQMGLKPTAFVKELNNTIGAELLKVHVSYGPLLLKALKKFNVSGRVIKGLAHITGGGFVDNIPRVLPKNCDVVVRKNSWEPLPIFQMLAAKGGVDEGELYQAFNMGIGMTLTVEAARADAVLRFVRAQKQKAWIIGEVTKGTGVVRMT